MFPHGPEDKIEAGEGRTVTQQSTVPIFGKDGEKSSQAHKNTLFIEKIDYGRTLTELPFSHPRQLVEMLPFLRQYAFLSILLSKSFGGSKSPIPEPKKKLEKKNKKDEFADFMKGASAPMEAPLNIDVSFSIQPLPRLQVVFPFKNRTANVVFDIKLNGVVEVVSQNIIAEIVDVDGDGMDDGNRIKVRDLGTMLEITEDLGIWVEFVRRRLD
jgi:hypothetical protein